MPKCFQKSITTMYFPYHLGSILTDISITVWFSTSISVFVLLIYIANKMETAFSHIFQQIKNESSSKCFRIIPLRKNILPFSDNCLKLQEELLAWHDSNILKGRQWENEILKGLVDLVYEGDVHLIFVFPFLFAAQQRHFHKTGMKQLIEALTYPSY